MTVDAELARGRDWALETLKAYLRIPSISAQKTGIGDAVGFLERTFVELGCQVRRLSGGGNPVLVATCGSGSRALTFYNHYDVQPPDPLGEWASPPFEPTIRDGKLFARGVADNKANLVARLAAARAWGGKPPVRVTFFVEGEEEIGSPTLARVVEANADALRADLCIWESSYRDETGRPQIILGCKGMVQGELVVRTAKTDAHSSRAVILPSAAWRLAQALACCRQGDEIIVAGLHDACVEPDAGEMELVRQIPFDEAEWRRNFGVDRFVKGLTGLALVKQFFYAPTFNISGLTSGYQGAGHKTVLPREARAKFDIRLVPDMEPQDVVAKLRRHLDANGFTDVAIEHVEGYPPARTPYTDPAVKWVEDAARGVWDKPTITYPHMIASGPMYLFRRLMPCIGIGVGHAQSNIHAPNESVYVEDFHAGAHHVSQLFKVMASV